MLLVSPAFAQAIYGDTNVCMTQYDEWGPYQDVTYTVNHPVDCSYCDNVDVTYSNPAGGTLFSDIPTDCSFWGRRWNRVSTPTIRWRGVGTHTFLVTWNSCGFGTYTQAASISVTVTNCACPTDLNFTSAGGIAKKECSNAITSTANISLSSGMYSWYDAGQSVTLNPGFEANVTSGEFMAFIEGCGGAHKTEAPAINQRQTFDSTIKVSPNPFHTTANISYNLDSDAPVSLTIFDATGRLVSTLVNNQTQSAGTYSHEFDGSNLAAGMYICHLQTGDKVQVQKIMLTR